MAFCSQISIDFRRCVQVLEYKKVRVRVPRFYPKRAMQQRIKTIESSEVVQKKGLFFHFRLSTIHKSPDRSIYLCANVYKVLASVKKKSR